MLGFANLLLLSGPSGGGKSTFAGLLKAGELPDEIVARLPTEARHWPVVDITNRMRRQIESEGEASAVGAFGAPVDVILHYDIATVYRYGLSGYESDPALRLLRLARRLSIVFVCPDAERLHAQFVARDADRKARKSAFARTWNRLVVGPRRRLMLRLSGQELNPERALYSDPRWITKCYAAWDAYTSALVKVGAAEGLLRVAPCEGGQEEPAFRIVTEPDRPTFPTGAETKG